MTPEAKSTLSKTIRRLRTRLIDDLAQATRRRYRLQVRPRESGLDERRLAERARLEDWLAEQVRAHENAGNKEKRDEASFLHDVIKEAAYTLLNRVILLRLMEEADLVSPAVIDGGWDSKGYREFTEWAPGLLDDETQGYQTLLNLVFDELAHDLPGLYGKVGLTELIPVPPATLRELVEQLNQTELDTCWSDDTTFGWVYQYWNDPEREELDAKLNAGGKIEPHEVASKTQLFTERYMVEWLLQNSLGQMWLATCKKNGWTPEVEDHGVLDELEERRKDWREKRENGEVKLDALMPIHSEVEERWKYWVPQPLPDETVETAPDSVWDMKILDPACGSGHFLVIAFDLLWALYQEEARHNDVSWSDEEILDNIFATNLHGIDIDPRAVQIAAAALYLKARTTREDYHPKTMSLVAPNLQIARLPEDDTALIDFRDTVTAETVLSGELVETILRSLSEAYHLGTLLKIDEAVEQVIRDSFGWGNGALADSRQVDDEVDRAKATILKQLDVFLARHSAGNDLGLRLHGQQLAKGIRFVRLNQENRYDVVVANPPYSGTSNLKNADYVQSNYSHGKADLFAAFLERGIRLTRPGGVSAMVTMRNWMFLKRYQGLRAYLTSSHHLRILNDLGTGAFAEIGGHVVSTALSVIDRLVRVTANSVALQSAGTEEKSVSCTARKRVDTLAQAHSYRFDIQKLAQIEGRPLVYWWDDEFLDRYLATPKLGDTFEVKPGLTTGNNTRFLRMAWEVERELSSFCQFERHFSKRMIRRWAPYVKGASGETWFDATKSVVNWEADGLEVRLANEGASGGRVVSEEFYFQPGVAFTPIGNSFAARSHRFRSIIDNGGKSIFTDKLGQISCLLNSNLAGEILQSLNPTVNFQVGDVIRLPLFEVESYPQIFNFVEESFTANQACTETSIEFQKPGPSTWDYAQDWAQKAVDRPRGEPLPRYEPEYEKAPPENWLSWAVGTALGRFGRNDEGWLDEACEDALPYGILFVTGTDSDDSLSHRATELLHEMWDKYGGKVGRNKDDLSSWLREKFFKSVHRQMYDNAPIYLPLSSENKTFVAHVSIHRWDEHTLRRLLADHLVLERTRLKGLMADLNKARKSDDDETRLRAEKKYANVQGWLDELELFIHNVEQCAEKGPPSTGKSCPDREVDARYVPDLDDGVLISSTALWPLLTPQWKKPQQWWKKLASEKGYYGKHFDWSKLAARYWPTRVDQKCQDDPSLAVAHGCFWKYHPERAYEWELRLQDEIHPNFTIDEDGSDAAREAFLTEHPDKVEDIRADEYKRRERNADGEADILPVVAPEEHPTSEDVVPEPDVHGDGDVIEMPRASGGAVGDRIKQCRKEAGLEREELAQVLGVDEEQLRAWEEDSEIPEKEQLFAISMQFGVDFDWLETGMLRDENAAQSDSEAMAARTRKSDEPQY